MPVLSHKTRSQSKIEGKNEHPRQEEEYEDDLADIPEVHSKYEEKKKS